MPVGCNQGNSLTFKEDEELKGKERLDALRVGADQSGFTLDFLECLTQGLSPQALRRVMGNASSMPSYMKSKDSPYLFRSARAPSSERR